MKRSLLILVFTVGSFCLWAQKSSKATSSGTVSVPSNVSTKFGTQYPDISPTWHKDGRYYSAYYTDKATQLGRNVVYDSVGTLVCTEYEMERVSYPQTITEYYTLNNPKEKYTIWWSTAADGTKSYYSKCGSGEIQWFDKEGKYIPEQKQKRTYKNGATAK